MLVFGAVQAQDEGAAAEGAAAAKRDADANDAAAAGKCAEKGDEEAWIYVEFLKNEINEKVEDTV